MAEALPVHGSVRRLVSLSERDIQQLAQVLVECVQGGASVSFMQPMTLARAETFWRGLADDVARGVRIVLVANDESGIVGTVQVILEQPENQPHRADIAKMLVHRRARGRGFGAALMGMAEVEARAAGKTLLVLDTASDEAERIYVRLGWILAGTIPDYALLPQGGLCDTRIYYRKLA